MATISVLNDNFKEPITKIIFDIDEEDNTTATLELRDAGFVRIRDLLCDAADVDFNKLCLAIDKAKELGWGNTES